MDDSASIIKQKQTWRANKTASKAKEKRAPQPRRPLPAAKSQQTPWLLELGLKRDELCQRMESNKSRSNTSGASLFPQEQAPRPQPLLPGALSEPGQETRKPQPLVSPQFPAGQHLITSSVTGTGLILLLSSQVSCAICTRTWTNCMWFFSTVLWTTQVQGFLSVTF